MMRILQGCLINALISYNYSVTLCVLFNLIYLLCNVGKFVQKPTWDMLNCDEIGEKQGIQKKGAGFWLWPEGFAFLPDTIKSLPLRGDSL